MEKSRDKEIARKSTTKCSPTTLFFSTLAVQTFMNTVYSIMNDARFKIFMKNYLTIIILLSTVNVAWNLLTSPMLIFPTANFTAPKTHNVSLKWQHTLALRVYAKYYVIWVLSAMLICMKTPNLFMQMIIFEQSESVELFCCCCDDSG